MRFLSAVATVGLLVLGLTVAAAPPPAVAAPALPPGFVLRDQPTGQAAFNLTDFAYLPDGSVLSTGKNGTVAWVGTTGSARTIATLPVNSSGDFGLVGLGVPGDYDTTHQIFLARSLAGTLTLRVERYTVLGGTQPTGLVLDRTIVEVQATSPVHGLTGILPAPDGTLWISIGDTADFSRVDPNALRNLDPNALQGKILHINRDGAGVPRNPYYDPANPSSVASRVWASGFRSPFRLTLDPSMGLPVLGDVGWNTWEEVDVVQRGGNYAWPCWEGLERTPGYRDMAECQGVNNTAPIWYYHHGGAIDQGNSVTGGIVYSGTTYPTQYRGAYFFGDYVGKKLWTLRYDAQGRLTQAPQNPPMGTDIGGPVKFAPATNGDIVYADIYTGNLRRLSYATGNAAPTAKITTTTDPATRTVTFDASGSVDFDGDSLTYTWAFGDGTTGSGVHTTHSYAAGVTEATATLTARDPLGATGTATARVVPGNHSPVLSLTTPGEHTFAVGANVALSGTATDAEDGGLPITWTSTVIHCPDAATCHSHPGVGGSGATFAVPFTEHNDSHMEITATATDAAGVSTSSTYLAQPREHRLTLLSNVPAALQIPAEGGASTAMVTEGATLDVVAAAVATDGASVFGQWSDGTTTRSRTLTVGGSDITLTANYTTPIDKRYNAEPALRQVLDTPSGPEVVDGAVHYRPFQNGRLYWTQATGVHEVHGGILAKYLQMGGHGRFGAPRTDEGITPDGTGRYNHFAGTPGTMEASLYWTPSTGVHAVYGAIRVRWSQTGWERGPMGYPITDETVTPDGIGRYNHFDKAASIYWTPANGAHDVYGTIRQKWSALGWERGPLGYPTTNETSTPDGVGRYNHFDKAGSVYWTPGTGAQEVYGAIRQRWSALGWERSYLGYPTSGEFDVPGGRRNNFQRGYIQWTRSSGAVIDRPY
jgi:hypothetical protein